MFKQHISMGMPKEDLDELIEACADAAATLTKFRSALLRFKKSGAGRPALTLLVSAIEEAIHNLDDPVEILGPTKSKNSGNRG